MAEPRPDLELRLPADGMFLAVLRTATAGLAARLDFTLDEIEDLRIAVDEACSLLLPQARTGADLRCAFFIEGRLLTVEVSAPCDEPREPSRDGFAWTVLSALTTSLETCVDGDTLVIRLSRAAEGADIR